MKIRNLRRRIARKIGAILIACGLMIPGALQAASLSTNLVVNPSFENVDVAVGGSFGSVKILDWQGAGPAGHGFAYNYGQGYDNRNGGVVPPGNDAASSEDYYFDGGSDADDSLEGIYQDIDVSGGDSGAAIAAGQGQYELSGWFSSYLTQGDFGNLTAEFLDGGSTSLGSITISDSDTSQWSQEVAMGQIPLGTATVRVSSAGTALSGNPDGYTDNVYFAVIPEPSSAILVGLGLASAGLTMRRRHSRS